MPARTPAGIAATLLIGLMAGPVPAQPVPDYDPSFVPAQMRMAAYPECRIRAPADPVWPRRHEAFRDANGKDADRITHELGVAFWKRDTRLGSRYSSNPNVRITYTCTPSGLRRKFFEGMVQSLHATAKRTRGEKWGAINRYEAPGLGPVWYFLGLRRSRKSGSETDVARVFFQHEGRSVSLMIQIARLPGKDMRHKSLRAGKVVDLVDDAGGHIRFRVTRKASQNVLGAVGFIRSEAENRQFILTILRNLKPL